MQEIALCVSLRNAPKTQRRSLCEIDGIDFLANLELPNLSSWRSRMASASADHTV